MHLYQFNCWKLIINTPIKELSLEETIINVFVLYSAIHKEGIRKTDIIALNLGIYFRINCMYSHYREVSVNCNKAQSIIDNFENSIFHNILFIKHIHYLGKLFWREVVIIWSILLLLWVLIMLLDLRSYFEVNLTIRKSSVCIIPSSIVKKELVFMSSWLYEKRFSFSSHENSSVNTIFPFFIFALLLLFFFNSIFIRLFIFFWVFFFFFCIIILIRLFIFWVLLLFFYFPNYKVIKVFPLTRIRVPYNNFCIVVSNHSQFTERCHS